MPPTEFTAHDLVVCDNGQPGIIHPWRETCINPRLAGLKAVDYCLALNVWYESSPEARCELCITLWVDAETLAKIETEAKR